VRLRGFAQVSPSGEIKSFTKIAELPAGYDPANPQNLPLLIGSKYEFTSKRCRRARRAAHAKS
jgi:hypothetical protein